uniref:Uncharacterized protein n=1 Tax=Anguilla anguilla TaxID=7936 RepID=A0A0E9X2V7_ANGAN
MMSEISSVCDCSAGVALLCLHRPMSWACCHGDGPYINRRVSALARSPSNIVSRRFISFDFVHGNCSWKQFTQFFVLQFYVPPSNKHWTCFV